MNKPTGSPHKILAFLLFTVTGWRRPDERAGPWHGRGEAFKELWDAEWEYEPPQWARTGHKPPQEKQGEHPQNCPETPTKGF